jgi:hypothetical protein
VDASPVEGLVEQCFNLNHETAVLVIIDGSTPTPLFMAAPERPDRIGAEDRLNMGVTGKGWAAMEEIIEA